MSDDEEYYEWEEDYLFDDVVPDFIVSLLFIWLHEWPSLTFCFSLLVQDDLAATSYYEAALYEDPAIDVEDYYSDWEYYSDDYFDDDPSVKQKGAFTRKKDTEEKNAGTKTRRTHPGPHRDKMALRAPPAKPDITSFQGVIWKTANLERDQDVAVQIYEPGHGDKVALLENWREIFKSVQPAVNKSRLRKRKAMVDREVTAREVPLAEDEFPCDGDDRRLESSDQSSDVDVDHMDESGDAGDASNTTPELGQSPKDAPSPMVLVPVKRGRKRKAEIPPEEVNKDNPGGRRGGVTKTRTRRVASEKPDGDVRNASAPSAPMRRSARQKN